MDNPTDNKQLVLDALEHPDVIDQAISRREAVRSAGHMGVGLALLSMPVALAAMAKRAFGQSALPNKIVDALNYVLTLEYLESTFYNLGVSSGVIPGSDLAVFQQIQKHENAHVAFLSGVLGSKAALKPTFDFTAGGQFDPFHDYAQFTVLSQGFEDTGVRAYKGQVGNVMLNHDILTAALRIHSVEARHASEVRRLRGLKGWITGDGADSPTVLQQAGVYAGDSTWPSEGNTTQLGIDVAKFQGPDAGSQAFDEPITDDHGLQIASLFFAKSA